MCMVTDNLGLVHHTVRRYYLWSTLDYDDLYQIGCIGLIKAAKKFDKTLGFQFATYAVKLIYGEIKRYLRDNNSIHFVRSDLEDMQKVRYAKTKCEDIEDICRYTELPQDRVKEVLLMLTPPISIHSQSPNTNNATLEKMLEDTSRDFTETVEMSAELDLLLNRLSLKERQIVVYRYFYDMTQTQIAEKLQTTQVSISRGLSTAMKKMNGKYTGVRTDAKSVIAIDEYGVETKYLSIIQASRETGLARNTILSACKDGHKTKGIEWRYA